VADIRKSLLPYRAQRRALGLESVEDYETVLLRLVAEERGYVKTQPPAAAVRCRDELGQSNPDLAVLEDLADATVQLTSLAASQILNDGQPEVASPPLEKAPEPTMSKDKSDTASSKACSVCQGALPVRRTATFCPHCGERLIPLTCTRCGSEFESGWRHCITCGAPVQDPYREQ
jgi:hypothetical protein